MNIKGGFVRKPLTKAETEYIRAHYADTKNSTIAKELGISKATVVKYGMKLSLTKDLTSEYNLGENNLRYKGGAVGKNGYRYLGVKRVRKLEHRHVMEQAIGRPLEAWEQVHHINHVRTDNRLENLKLVTKHTHGAEHRKEACMYGHKLSGNNLARYGKNRVCRACHRNAAKRRLDRIREPHRSRRREIVAGVRKDYGAMPVLDIANKYGISWRSVYRYAKADPKYWY